MKLLTHTNGCLGLRLLGLGPYFIPRKGLKQLKYLLENSTFWANQRTLQDLRIMLKNSTISVSLWDKGDLIGFGRATSDKVYRSVIWDVVISNQLQGTGLGKNIIDKLINHKTIKRTEKIYLMTTNQESFYKNNGFEVNTKQSLMQIIN